MVEGVLKTDVAVIGAGQAGLAVSRHLSKLGIDHSILERGKVGNSWHKERWDSLTLLSPNWHSRLPGRVYEGNDPDGFLTRTQTVDLLTQYSGVIAAPVVEDCLVTRLSKTSDDLFELETTRQKIHARSVVIATGACNAPVIPVSHKDLSSRIQSLTAFEYKNPGQIDGQGVLVVGASASGLQIAQELVRSGRKVWLSVGKHLRTPRRYRGHDIIRWLVDIGIFDQSLSAMPNGEEARRTPSMQLSGNSLNASLSLNTLQDEGVQIVGRLNGITETIVHFDDSLTAECDAADTTLFAMLRQIDAFAERIGLSGQTAYSPARTRIPPPTKSLDLATSGIGTVLWATGYRPDYSWLDLPVLTKLGTLIEREGVTNIEGLYALGLPFMRKRKSAFIDGVGEDAKVIARHIEKMFSG